MTKRKGSETWLLGFKPWLKFTCWVLKYVTCFCLSFLIYKIETVLLLSGRFYEVKKENLCNAGIYQLFYMCCEMSISSVQTRATVICCLHDKKSKPDSVWTTVNFTTVKFLFVHRFYGSAIQTVPRGDGLSLLHNWGLKPQLMRIWVARAGI